MNYVKKRKKELANYQHKMVIHVKVYHLVMIFVMKRRKTAKIGQIGQLKQRKLHMLDQVDLVLQIVNVLVILYQKNLNLIMYLDQHMDQRILNII